MITGESEGATAIVCDPCVLTAREIREAVEFHGFGAAHYEVFYHAVESLEELPPERTYVIKRLKGHGRGIYCLRCGHTSWNPDDVKNKYCDCCEEFHNG